MRVHEIIKPINSTNLRNKSIEKWWYDWVALLESDSRGKSFDRLLEELMPFLSLVHRSIIIWNTLVVISFFLPLSWDTNGSSSLPYTSAIVGRDCPVEKMMPSRSLNHRSVIIWNAFLGAYSLCSSSMLESNASSRLPNQEQNHKLILSWVNSKKFLSLSRKKSRSLSL